MKSRDKRRKRKKKLAKTNWEQWNEATAAKLCTEKEFLSIKEGRELYLVGVMGFAGSWKHAPYKGEKLQQWISFMRQVLSNQLLAYQSLHGENLVMVSGATSMGVLEITYSLCEENHISAMGVTSDRALRYELGKMDFVLPYGKSFGDESELFVRVCDEFLWLGGGKQSAYEAKRADKDGKVVSILQGFGGSADEAMPEELPLARFFDVSKELEQSLI